MYKNNFKYILQAEEENIYSYELNIKFNVFYNVNEIFLFILKIFSSLIIQFKFYKFIITFYRF